jgi:SAM-dependent methyltransferase
LTTSSTFTANDGDGYERLMGRWSKRLAEPFLDFAGTQEGESVLDAGCGTGHLAQAVAQRNLSGAIRAVDLAPVYVEHARSHNRDPRIVFEVGDVCALDFPARSFDRVLSMLVLHFVPNSALAVAELCRVARPGAVVAACVWDARGGLVFNRMFFDTAAALDPNANERRAKNFTRPMTRPGELGKAWRAAGLHDVVESSITMRMEFSSFEDYWTPNQGREGPIADYVATLGPAERARLIEAMRRAYLDGEADGPRSYAAIAWTVKGTAPASS